MSLAKELSDFMASYYGLSAGFKERDRFYGPELRGRYTADLDFEKSFPSYVSIEPVRPVPRSEKLVCGMEQVKAFEKVLLGLCDGDLDTYLLWHGKDDENLLPIFKPSNQWGLHEFRYHRPVMHQSEFSKIAKKLDIEENAVPDFTIMGVYTHEKSYLQEAHMDWCYIPEGQNADPLSSLPRGINLPDKAYGNSVRFMVDDKGQYLHMYEDGSICFFSMVQPNGEAEFRGSTCLFWDAGSNHLTIRILVKSFWGRERYDCLVPSEKATASCPNRLLEAAPWLSRSSYRYDCAQYIRMALRSLGTTSSVANRFMSSIYYVRFLRGEISSDEFSDFGGRLNSKIRSRNLLDLGGYLELTYETMCHPKNETYTRDVYEDEYRKYHNIFPYGEGGHSASDYIVNSKIMGFATCDSVSVEVSVGCSGQEEVGLVYKHAF